MMRTFFGALVVGVPVNVMYKFYRQKLSLSWREWLTNRITDVRLPPAHPPTHPPM